MSSADTFQFVHDELSSGSPARQLVVVNNLKKISMALGVDTFLETLLPKVTESLTSVEYSDEVCVKIAEVLGEFVDFVGGAGSEKLVELLTPLEVLCGYDETAVRDQAVSSILAICKGMTPAMLQSHLWPITDRLAKNTDWWAPRVSACGLLALSYKAWVGPEEGERRKAVLEQFRLLCNEEAQQNPMVKSAAASQLGEVVDSMGEYANAAGIAVTEAYFADAAAHGVNIGDLYVKLLDDDHDYVKVAAVRSSPLVFKHFPLDSTKDNSPGEKYEKCTVDKSWRVRVTVCETVTEVVKNSKGVQRGCRVVKQLMQDPEAEVKHAIGERSATVAEVLGEEFAEEEIFPKLKALFMPIDCTIREKLAGVLMDMAAPLGPERATRCLLDDGLFQLMVSDESHNVRLAALNKLKGDFLEVVRVNTPAGTELLNNLSVLAGAVNWRVRHAVMELLPKLVEIYKEDSPSDFRERIMELFGFKIGGIEPPPDEEMRAKFPYGEEFFHEAWAFDPMAQIRGDFLAVISKVAATFGGELAPRDPGNAGAEWLQTNMVPVLLKCDDKEFKHKYHQRSVLLMGVVHLGAYFGVEQLESDMVPRILAMAKDGGEKGSYVANLRLMVAREMPGVAKHVSKQYVLQDINPALDELQKDPDVDVSAFSKSSIDAIAEM
jgi:serine/threonine-protein phosphatase 2A regulatory subunit A